jgi:hypothetical protein
MSGWLAYGEVVCRIFEVGRYRMAEKICRPGFTYNEDLGKSLYVDQGIALHTYREICRPGFRTVTEREFPSCGTWKVRRRMNGGEWRRFDVRRCYVLYMVRSTVNVRYLYKVVRCALFYITSYSEQVAVGT